ncbi:MAG: AAA family ATPase, partial [Pseudomonadota bacterium]|nr:AAA family ATPase [Pseudomonadota bacterium]
MLQTNHDLPDGTIKSAKRNVANNEKAKTLASSIAELKLTNFRSHAKAHIFTNKGIVVLSGDNGVGKTNILEAISMLGPGRGLRTAKLSELARRDGANAWSVSALVRTQEEDIQIGVGIDPGADTRRLRID